jgi:hypothetical protein
VGLQSYARAQELGIDVTLQTEYVWIGHEFSRAGVPSPWSEYSDDHGQIFYYNHETCVHSPSLSTPAHSCPCGSGGMLPLAWKWVSVGVFDANGELAPGGGGGQQWRLTMGASAHRHLQGAVPKVQGAACFLDTAYNVKVPEPMRGLRPTV